LVKILLIKSSFAMELRGKRKAKRHGPDQVRSRAFQSFPYSSILVIPAI